MVPAKIAGAVQLGNNKQSKPYPNPATNEPGIGGKSNRPSSNGTYKHYK